MSKEKKIHITPIQNGTAIDHLPIGTALKILSAIDFSGHTFTAAMNVESKKMGKKDILFVEGKKLTEEELNKIRLLGKGGTLNEIAEAKVVKKENLDYPEHANGIISCINDKCITNKEGLITKFRIAKNPLEARCFYCETRMNKEEIMESVKGP
ncbi:MAG: aspartate carbamoyltransferase regulatory subunit [Candidatus Diapherotrites archaeon]